jgi:predicted O-methyltransferase YrrM
MQIARAQEIEGWMDDVELTYLAQQAASHMRIVEIGSWMGRSTRALADNTSGQVYAVDAFAAFRPDGSDVDCGTIRHIWATSGDTPDWQYNKFVANMKDTTVVVQRMLSLDAAKYFADGGQTFDMVFLDARHDYASVKEDIEAWYPRLVSGGLMCGHDADFVEVWQAVKENCPRAQVEAGSIWAIIKS